LSVVAGVDLGGTAINYTFLDRQDKFLLEELCEYPARSKEGPEICLRQIEDGLQFAANRAGIALSDISVVGLDTPGPASAKGVLSAKGSTNFVHANWAGFDIPVSLSKQIGKPVIYLNDGDAAALWGHFSIFGANADRATSVSVIVGTGLGGGVIIDGRGFRGRKGFGSELGHVLIPYQSIPSIAGLHPICNCGRKGDLESVCSLTAIGRSFLPYFLPKYPGHELGTMEITQAAKLVRGRAEAGDPMCKAIFQAQAHALGLFFDMMINTFDPDALIVGGGVIETGEAFRQWFLDEIRAGMPAQREEQADIPIYIMPNGDTAGARGAALEALKYAVEMSVA
jgi:predicted NBD/HSP70 family sugar kinase